MSMASGHGYAYTHKNDGVARSSHNMSLNHAVGPWNRSKNNEYTVVLF